MVRWFVAGTGASGKKGFWCQHSRLFEQKFSFHHSEYFERGHMDTYWILFIRKEIAADLHHESLAHRPRTNIPWGLYGVYFTIAAMLAILFVPWERLAPSAEVATLREENQKMGGEARKTQARLAAMESELEATKRQLGSTTQALEPTLTTPPVTVYLGAIGAIRVPYIRNLGPMTTLNSFSLSRDIWRKLVVEDIAVVITAPKENMLLKVNLESIFGVGLQDIREQLPHGRGLLVQPPNYEVDIDAPRLKDSGYSGIIIHGHSSALELIDNFLRDCFVTRQTPKIVDGLPEYYKAHNVMWIEIGTGSPWKTPSACWG
jgi:hypothetical protein